MKKQFSRTAPGWGTRLPITAFLFLTAAASARVVAGSDPSPAGLAGQEVTVVVIQPGEPDTVYAGTRGEGALFKTIDGGNHWARLESTYRLAYRIAALLVDRSEPSTLYLGSSDGVFKSTDDGAGWVRTSSGLPTTITALAADPHDSVTLYAGSWGEGVFRTTDGGEEWSATAAGPGRGFVYALALAPGRPSTLYAGTGEGLFRSRDRGETWLPLASGLPRETAEALAIESGNPDNLYVAVNSWVAGSGYVGLVFRSRDGGDSWSRAGEGLPGKRVRALAIHPRDPAVLFCGTEEGLFRSGDGGGSWVRMDEPVGIRHVTSLAISEGPALYAGAAQGGVFRVNIGP